MTVAGRIPTPGSCLAYPTELRYERNSSDSTAAVPDHDQVRLCDGIALAHAVDHPTLPDECLGLDLVRRLFHEVPLAALPDLGIGGFHQRLVVDGVFLAAAQPLGYLAGNGAEVAFILCLLLTERFLIRRES